MPPSTTCRRGPDPLGQRQRPVRTWADLPAFPVPVERRRFSRLRSQGWVRHGLFDPDEGFYEEYWVRRFPHFDVEVWLFSSDVLDSASLRSETYREIAGTREESGAFSVDRVPLDGLPPLAISEIVLSMEVLW